MISGTTCADGASFELTKLELGSGKLYAGAAADLIGKGSNFTARIGYLGQGEQRLDMNYVARHRGKKTTCEMDSTGVLAGKAFKLFRGSIDLLPAVPAPRARSRRTFCCWATAWSTRPFR